jgi:DNA-binding XRE family transcriptional regulator
MPKTPPSKKAAARQLGALMRAARGSRTQEELGAAVGLSKSTISRFERGDEVPDLEQARLLDEALGTDRMIRNAVRGILYNPMPGVLAIPRKLSVIVYEPQHVGAVYVQLTAASGVVRNVRVLLCWGGKQRPAPNPLVDGDFAFLDPEGFRVDEAGIALVFAKLGTDRTALTVRTNESLMLSDGLGLPMLDDERLLDVNQGWLTP